MRDLDSYQESVMTMTRNVAKLAIDERERAILDKLPAATLAKVRDIKNIFGKGARVIDFRTGPSHDDQWNLDEAQPAQEPQALRAEPLPVVEAVTETESSLDWIFDDFLSLLFGKCAGNIELRAFPSKSRLFSRDRAKLLSFIKSHLDEEVFFGCATRRGEDGTKKGALEIPALWADVDFKDFEDGEREAREVVKSFSLEPSIVVHSGHGFHLYFILKEPLRASAKIEGYLKGITRALRADMAVAELARVLRLPGTFNRKDGAQILVTIEAAK